MKTLTRALLSLKIDGFGRGLRTLANEAPEDKRSTLKKLDFFGISIYMVTFTSGSISVLWLPGSKCSKNKM